MESSRKVAVRTVGVNNGAERWSGVESEGGGEEGGELVRRAVSYKATAYVLWQRGARKLLEAGT